jgi:hypothetical protein
VTGVGATPASGSQVWNGRVALLAKMPAVISATARPEIGRPRISSRLKVPDWA